MSVTIRDNQTAELFAQTIGAGVEVFGPDGQLLGRFTPAPRPGMMMPEFGMTDEEIEQFDNDPNAVWVSAADVEKRLRELGGQQ